MNIQDITNIIGFVSSDSCGGGACAANSGVDIERRFASLSRQELTEIIFKLASPNEDNSEKAIATRRKIKAIAKTVLRTKVSVLKSTEHEI